MVVEGVWGWQDHGPAPAAAQLGGGGGGVSRRLSLCSRALNLEKGDQVSSISSYLFLSIKERSGRQTPAA